MYNKNIQVGNHMIIDRKDTERTGRIYMNDKLVALYQPYILPTMWNKDGYKYTVKLVRENVGYTKAKSKSKVKFRKEITTDRYLFKTKRGMLSWIENNVMLRK